MSNPASYPNSASDNSAMDAQASSTFNSVTRLASAPISPKVVPAIDGYCPVALRSKQWRKGEPQFAVKHRGMLFHLADAASQEEFLRKPDHYTPILLSNDPLVLLNQGRLVPGSTQHGLFEDRFGALFFESAESKAEFHRNFLGNMERLEKLEAILQRTGRR